MRPWFVLWFALGAACADAGAEQDATLIVPPDAGATDAAARPDARQVELPPVGQPAYLDVQIAPRALVYRLAESPAVMAAALDQTDSVVEADIQLTVEPPTAADIVDGALQFRSEGPGAVRACAGEVCGLAHFYVDDAPPVLTVESPTPAARIIGDPRILVTGDVSDSGPIVVYVNDQPARVGDNGRFSAEVEARFGLNRIDVVADDGAHDPPARVVLEVLWAPETLPVEPRGVRVENAMVLRVDQAQLDANVPYEEVEGGVQAIDLAGVLEAAAARIDPLGFIDLPLPSGDPLTLRIDGLSLGAPLIDLTLEDDGVSLFARLPRIQLTTGGSLQLEDVGRYVLDGDIFVDGAAFARLSFRLLADMPAELRVSSTRVAVESIDPALEDARAQALVETVGSLLREAVEGYADDLVRGVVTDGLGDLLQGLLAQGLGALGTFSLPPPIDGLSVGFALTEPTFARRTDLTLALAADIRHDDDVEAPHVDRGVAGEALAGGPPWPAEGRIGVAIRLVALNALLHEVWRRGNLQLDLSALVPADLPLLQGARLDARLPPVVVPGEPGGPYPLVAQVGETDLFLNSPSADGADHYVLSIRAGILFGTEDGIIRLDLADDPDVRVALKSSAGARPLFSADALKTLVEAVVWPQVRDAIGAGLTLPTDTVTVDGRAFGLGTLRIEPVIGDQPLVRNGWVMLPGEILFGLE